MAAVAPLEREIGESHPDLVVTTLLQHALAAARVTLGATHIELGQGGDLGQVDHDTHLALLIDIHLDALDKLLVEYRQVVEKRWWTFQEDIPF